MSDDLIRDQYRDSSKLMARMRLQLKYGSGGGAMAAMPARIPPGARVLEVGCGPGRFWERSADKLPADLDILLTDLSPGMVDEAVERVAAVGRWSAVRGQVADVCSLPFEANSFDLVLAMHMLYHADDPERAVSEIARVLRPDGVLIATTNGLASMSALFELGQAAFGGPAGDAGLGDFSLESGEPLVRRHFGEVEVERSRDELHITDPVDVTAYLTSFPPGDVADGKALRRLDEEVRSAFEAGGGVLRVTRDMGYIVGRHPRF